MIQTIQNTAIDVTNAEKHQGCGASTRTTVTQALERGRQLNSTLTKVPFDPDRSYQRYFATNFLNIDVGIKIETHCKFASDEVAAEVKNAYKTVMQFTLLVVGSKAINQIFSQSLAISKSPQFQGCGANVRRIVNGSVHQLKQTLETVQHDLSLPR